MDNVEEKLIPALFIWGCYLYYIPNAINKVGYFLETTQPVSIYKASCAEVKKFSEIYFYLEPA